MEKMLNLFAGIGGNRLPWTGNIVAVEHDEDMASIYKQRFPNDEMVIDDAWTYLEDHFHEFDFIWASPPCPSHSKISRTHAGRRYNGFDMKVEIPDMRLYGIIMFLQHHFRGEWVVENVKPFYTSLIERSFVVGRHVFWSNLGVPSSNLKTKAIMYKLGNDYIEYLRSLCDTLELDFKLIEPMVKPNWSYGNDKIGQILRNTIHPEVARYIWDRRVKNELW